MVSRQHGKPTTNTHTRHLFTTRKVWTTPKSSSPQKNTVRFSSERTCQGRPFPCRAMSTEPRFCCCLCCGRYGRIALVCTHSDLSVQTLVGLVLSSCPPTCLLRFTYHSHAECSERSLSVALRCVALHRWWRLGFSGVSGVSVSLFVHLERASNSEPPFPFRS